jgi:hypothetical protein
VATGWAELLKGVRQERDRGELDHEEVWEAFEELAPSSRHISTLDMALRLGRKLPPSQRYLLVVILMRLLAPVEWPLEWEAARPRLVTALDHLLRETNPDSSDSFPALLDLQGDGEMQAVGYAALISARDLLRGPCRRADLVVVARLCNISVVACLRLFRRALARMGSRATEGPLIDARMRFVVAFEHYAQAAREFNDACGAVLFQGLDARLDVSEA